MIDREAFRKAVESRSLDEMMAPFAEDAVLHSPITFTPFEGRAAIRFDVSGRIVDFTVFIRPRSAIEALLAEVAPRLTAAIRGAA